MTLRPGSVFAGYTIERLLGSGGMGSVYLAKHPRLPRSDALKLLSVDFGANPSFRARFEREADIASRLNHPNVVTVYDRGAEAGRLWISMQYIDGTDIAELITYGPRALPVARTVKIIADAAKGLDHAHRFGLLHRDVKPANILVARAPDEPGGERALITDFGIARAVDETHNFTQTGDVLATISYAAPEQLEGHAIDHRADIYALGCTLFEMLTGHTPFPRDNPLAVMKAHLMAPPPRATESVPGLPPAIDAVIARALAKDPAQRYDSCRALAEAAATALSAGRPPTTPAPQGPAATLVTGPPRRSGRRLAVAATAAIVVAVIGIGGFFATRSSTSDDARSDSTSAAATTTTDGPTTATSTTTTTSTTPAPNGYTTSSQRVQGSTDTAVYDVALPRLDGGNPSVTAEFNESMRSALQDQIDFDYGTSFTLTGDGSEITHVGERVVSGLVATSWNADPPGAHPTPLIATIVVDADTGRPITLDDLFTDTNAGIQRLAEQAALLLPDTAAGADFEPSGIAPDATNFANWLATPAGMEIHFTDGQVGPHAIGLVVVTVPWAELSDVLAPGMEPVVSS